MKNYRPNQLKKGKEDDKNTRYSPFDRKAYSPPNSNLNNRLLEYETLAKKAKDQLKQFQIKRKHSPKVNAESKQKLRQKFERSPAVQPLSKSHSNQQTLQHSHSHKIFKRETNNEGTRHLNKEQRARPGQLETGRLEKLSADAKIDSPSKKHYIDSNEYKKLHQKLDLIENKISDMKKNLQKKKQEKQKNIESKHRQERESQQERKNGLKALVTKVPEQGELHTFHSNPYSPRHNVYYVSELIRAYKDQRSLAREHLTTSLNILKALQKSRRQTQEEIDRIALKLNRKKGYQDKNTIVFDLDQTLIHCNDTLNPPYDIKIPIKFPTGELIEAGINIRPYSKQLLKNLSKYFQIIVFTASHSCYANQVIDHLDPKRQYVHHRLFRQHCYLSPQGMYIKDLRIINRDLKGMLLVDNAAYSYAYQLQNGVPIFPYYHGSVDFQLKMLQDYLMKFVLCKDVRELNQKTFNLTQYKRYYGRPQKLVEELYLNK